MWCLWFVIFKGTDDFLGRLNRGSRFRDCRDRRRYLWQVVFFGVYWPAKESHERREREKVLKRSWKSWRERKNKKEMEMVTVKVKNEEQLSWESRAVLQRADSSGSQHGSHNTRHVMSRLPSPSVGPYAATRTRKSSGAFVPLSASTAMAARKLQSVYKYAALNPTIYSQAYNTHFRRDWARAQKSFWRCWSLRQHIQQDASFDQCNPEREAWSRP